MENEDKIKELLTRGVERIYPNAEFLEQKLRSGEKLSLYLGIDPTGPTLHLGHLIPILKLLQFQNLGHKVTLLVGDFTATIGDPTDKLAPRTALSAKEVTANAKGYKKQAARILAFEGKNPAMLRRNSEWLNTLPMAEMFSLLSNLTYAQIIKRDMFQERIKEGKDLNANELLYPALQGYDSVAMDVDGEVGGNDQTFNMLMGRDLLKKLRGKEKFVVSMKMLADSFGKKMGKTEGNRVSLDEKPSEMFGKIMSWPDGMILPAFELCTTVPLAEIAEVKKGLESGANPKTAKEKLAESIVSLYYGTKKAVKAREAFESTFSERKLPADIKEFKTEAGAVLSDCLLAAGIVASKGEWRRLVEEKAVSSVASNGGLEKILDVNFKISGPAVFKIGKHRFLKVVM
ncbi:MAG: Tyrosine-tRNA ligase [Parcubacteria group bacterium GW2011_GWA2_44_15]|nr:MAG: Tyrosine-tRNA ligase [Parcubacteria group bacterium GW2011_GWA2_44_15]